MIIFTNNRPTSSRVLNFVELHCILKRLIRKRKVVPFLCLTVKILRWRQRAAASGQRQRCDPTRRIIDAHLFDICWQIFCSRCVATKTTTSTTIHIQLGCPAGDTVRRMCLTTDRQNSADVTAQVDIRSFVRSFICIKAGFKGGQTGQLPRAFTTKGASTKTVKIITLGNIKILFETDNLE